MTRIITEREPICPKANYTRARIEALADLRRGPFVTSIDIQEDDNCWILIIVSELPDRSPP